MRKSQKTVRNYQQAPSIAQVKEILEQNKNYFDSQCQDAQQLFLKTELLEDGLFASVERDAVLGVRFGDPRPPAKGRYFDSVLVQRVYGREIGDILK